MTEKLSIFENEVSKMENSLARDIILKLKAVKEAEHMSISDILVKLELAGANISESTVRRVFRDNSENEGGFTYIKVLKPIADVMLDDKIETVDDPALLEKNSALHAIIKEKNRMIEALEEKNEALSRRNEDLKRQIEDLRRMYDDRIDKLWIQIGIKDKRMDEKDAIIKQLMEKVL